MSAIWWYLLGLANGYAVAMLLIIFMINRPENWNENSTE